MWVSVAVSCTASSSCLAVTSTGCAVFQFVVLNVSVFSVTFRSVPLVPPTVTVTGPVGCVASFTV